MNANNSLTLIVDFDRTIFDSDSLYRDLYSVCEERGVSRDYLIHKLGLVPPDNLLFNFFLMVERSQAINDTRCKKLIKELRFFIREKGHRYVFPDVHPFLISALKTGCRVVILTYGDIAFQSSKFEGCGLSKLCYDFIVTEDYKFKSSIIVNSSSIIYFDDNPRDIIGVKNCFPNVIIVEVKRPGTKYADVFSTNADIVANRLDWPLVY